MSVQHHKILSEYVDIVNTHGRGSAQAQAFRAKYSHDTELTKLFAVSDRTQQQFEKRILPPPNDDPTQA